MDLPRSYTIRESSHRICDPFTAEKFAILGAAIRLRPGMTVLDLCCGKGEMLSSWARDHQVTGVGIDISTVSIAAAIERAAEFGVSDNVEYLHGDASHHVSAEPVDVAACIGASWIGDGITGTIALLERSLRPGGTILVGEPFWRGEPPTGAEALQACHAETPDFYRTLPALVEHFGELGYDLVEMVLADEDSWDRYRAASWLNLRTWLDENPHDELAPELRAELDTAPLEYVRYSRPLLGWGVFALMKR
ncbi:SAM-dependent methyltransferase [Allocatelliglobosispora scoriae]|uniref:SAM-dependent methyltransferase n=1 Tax=Allocatelliglobosispora scoriae TaxID=643052 RepID=A0A841BMF4_9ACTN|nr:class I SAM-dependent methyltransferase [Allocatelliglobosispora scoriae]MBB5868153.1 SAM-dependent methyltransferase [Allocatelliglobosispora scoriae]